MAARIRAACMEDFDALDRLMRRAVKSLAGISDELVDHPQSFRVSPDEIDAGHALIAEDGETLAGFAVWHPIGELTAQIEGIFVDPSMWGHGVGLDLLQSVCRAVTESGFRNVFVVAVAEAAEFYRHHGFVRTGATSTPLGPAITLMKDIEAS